MSTGLCNAGTDSAMSPSPCVTCFLTPHPMTGYMCRVADGMLREYVSTGELDPSDVTGNLGAAVLRNERMTFIGRHSSAWLQ